jgi:ADP-heptose:LPS heptosyltransferase
LRKILVLRFSAMGDVVLLVPVVRSIVAAYSDIEVTVVTRPKFASFFTDIERVVPFPVDVDYTYNGVFGMRDLFKKLLHKGPFEVVIDAHDHVRTMILRTLFKLFGVPVVVFDKGRPEKKKFTQKENKETKPLPHTIQRYQQAFENAGFPVTIIPPPYLTMRSSTLEETGKWLESKEILKNETWIGIAPFAMHTTKIWPLKNYALLMEQLIKAGPVKFFLFGGGQKEINAFVQIQKLFPAHCHIVAGELKIKQELALMQKLDLMICVDSSNMHFASLLGIPLISIWGGTHPDVGFGPYNTDKESVLQISRDELPCRPCSVYGRETCYRGDFACLTRITPENVLEEVKVKLELNARPDKNNNL